MSNQITIEAAQAQFAAEEFARQIVDITTRLANERVRAIQLDQSLRETQEALAAATEALEAAGSDADPRDDFLP